MSDAKPTRAPFVPVSLAVGLTIRYLGQTSGMERPERCALWERGGRQGRIFSPAGSIDLVIETGHHRFLLSGGDGITAVCELLDLGLLGDSPEPPTGAPS